MLLFRAGAGRRSRQSGVLRGVWEPRQHSRLFQALDPSARGTASMHKAPALLILSVPSTAASSHRAQVRARLRPLGEKR